MSNLYERLPSGEIYIYIYVGALELTVFRDSRNLVLEGSWKRGVNDHCRLDQSWQRKRVLVVLCEMGTKPKNSGRIRE